MSLSLAERKHFTRFAGLALVVCCMLQACGSPPRAPAVTQVTPVPPPVTQAPVVAEPVAPRLVSTARSAHEYRQHAARHVYDQHAAQIYSGPMPPLLQAVGVLDIEIGSQGEIRRLNWLRPPSHVPAVMRQIEHMIHQAAPYPAPLHLQSVTYTDTWLWHQSGRFQLHTLSEGQLGEVSPSIVQKAEQRPHRRRSSPPTSTLSAKCPHPPTVTNPAPTYC